MSTAPIDYIACRPPPMGSAASRKRFSDCDLDVMEKSRSSSPGSTSSANSFSHEDEPAPPSNPSFHFDPLSFDITATQESLNSTQGHVYYHHQHQQRHHQHQIGMPMMQVFTIGQQTNPLPLPAFNLMLNTIQNGAQMAYTGRGAFSSHDAAKPSVHGSSLCPAGSSSGGGIPILNRPGTSTPPAERRQQPIPNNKAVVDTTAPPVRVGKRASGLGGDVDLEKLVGQVLEDKRAPPPQQQQYQYSSSRRSNTNTISNNAPSYGGSSCPSSSYCPSSSSIGDSSTTASMYTASPSPSSYGGYPSSYTNSNNKPNPTQSTSRRDTGGKLPPPPPPYDPAGSMMSEPFTVSIPSMYPRPSRGSGGVTSVVVMPTQVANLNTNPQVRMNQQYQQQQSPAAAMNVNDQHFTVVASNHYSPQTAAARKPDAAVAQVLTTTTTTAPAYSYQQQQQCPPSNQQQVSTLKTSLIATPTTTPLLQHSSTAIFVHNIPIIATDTCGKVCKEKIGRLLKSFGALAYFDICPAGEAQARFGVPTVEVERISSLRASFRPTNESIPDDIRYCVVLAVFDCSKCLDETVRLLNGNFTIFPRMGSIHAERKAAMLAGELCRLDASAGNSGEVGVTYESPFRYLICNDVPLYASLAPYDDAREKRNKQKRTVASRFCPFNPNSSTPGSKKGPPPTTTSSSFN